MGTGIALRDLQAAIDSLLGGGAQPETILLIQATRRFPDCEAGALADALTHLLHSRYVPSVNSWRVSRDPAEAQAIEQKWRKGSERRRIRLLRRMRGGRALDAYNQFEVAEWIEEAVREESPGQIERLFPLLKREYFTDEHWFELERCFNESNESHRAVQEAETQLSLLREELGALAQRVLDVRERIRTHERELKKLRRAAGVRAPRKERVPRRVSELRPGPQPRRFTGIIIRAGEKEGKINSVLRDLGILARGAHGQGSEPALRLLLQAGHHVEVIQGNAQVPAGTVFNSVADLGRPQKRRARG